MLNKDKRSLLLMLVLGDGCLHYIRNGKKMYGGLTIDHGIQQADYQAWKAKLMSEITGREVRLRPGHKGKSVQVSVCMKRLRAWRKFCYPGGKKNRSRIFPFIRHPELATAVWICDDGHAETNGGQLRIYTCSSTEDTHDDITAWFKKHFDVETRLKWANSIHYKKPYRFIKFTQADSLKIWAVIREFCLQFKSMQHKFRSIEKIYQSKCIQRLPSGSKTAG